MRWCSGLARPYGILSWRKNILFYRSQPCRRASPSRARIILRKNDAEIKKLVDDTIRGLFKSGEINKIYSKWFMSPIPPKNIVLNAAMNDALKKSIADPTNSALPSAYSPDDFFK